MGFDEGRIILDNENGNYVAGQTVYGRIIFDQGKPKDIHGIYVSCKGFCKVHWTTTETRTVNKRSHTRTIHHESYEEYFKRKYFVVGSEDGECYIKEGHHEFKFSCNIPMNCPSSFEGEYGHIRYRVKVVMVTLGMFSFNKEKRVAIQISTPLDLNQNPHCKDPIEFDLNNTYCCWCMSAGYSEIRVKLPVGGYCPGQVIPMEVSAVNHSNVDIDELKFAIKQKIKFEATTNPATKYDSSTVAAIKKGPIPAHTTRNWQVDMEVPAMNVYNLNACRYIDIEHVFKVSMETDGCHDDGDESHPIVIGHIPLLASENEVHIPLHDQNAQAVNYYPPQPIIQQPSVSNYPNQRQSFGGQPYPLIGSPYPPSDSPYPPSSSPYPPSSSPYPPSGSPHPPRSGAKHDQLQNPDLNPYMPQPSQNPNISGNPSTVPPGGSFTHVPSLSDDPPPYPGVGSLPYMPLKDNVTHEMKSKTPYPTDDDLLQSKTDINESGQSSLKGDIIPPYPTNETMPSHSNQSVPYPKSPSGSASTSDITGGQLKTGTIGFVVPVFGETKSPAHPVVPPYRMSPATNPYAIASAPEPSTPGSDNSVPSITLPRSPAYNPDFVDKDKTTDKHN